MGEIEYFVYDLKDSLEKVKKLDRFTRFDINVSPFKLAELVKDGYVQHLGLQVFEPYEEVSFTEKTINEFGVSVRNGKLKKPGKGATFYKLTEKGKELAETLEHKIDVEKIGLLSLTDIMEDIEKGFKENPINRDYIEFAIRIANENGRNVPNEDDRNKAICEIRKRYFGNFDSMFKE
ncbi:MAG: hypothetical protein PHU12_04470 [Candidatus Aenigmarchaeota archaeon]|nr:hypothetical protein [Candidatus Aenigmarchaeota archaeon]